MKYRVDFKCRGYMTVEADSKRKAGEDVKRIVEGILPIWGRRQVIIEIIMVKESKEEEAK